MAESALSLVERLRAALDRAEEIARAATPGPWWDSPAQSAPSHHTIRGGGRPAEKGRPGDVRSVASFDRRTSNRSADIAFIVANDPAAVLRTVAAHRKILDRHRPLHREIAWTVTEYAGVPDEAYGEIEVCERCVPKHSHFSSRSSVPEYPCDDVRDLAAVYFPEAPDA